MPETERTIRPATPADLPAMYALLTACVTAEPEMLGACGVRQGLRKLHEIYSIEKWYNELTRLPERSVYMLHVAPRGTIAGIAVGGLKHERQPKVPKEHNGHLTHLAVLPDYRGQGYASNLLAGFAQSISTLGARGVRLNVFASQTHALEVYLHHGFIIRATTPDALNPNRVLHHMSMALEHPQRSRVADQHASI